MLFFVNVVWKHFNVETKKFRVSQSRPCLSLLAHCYFYTQDFVGAADCYEKLVHICPEESLYKLLYAQSLHQACLYQEAWTVCSSIVDQRDLESKVRKLQAAIKYGQEDVVAAKALIDQCPEDDVDTEINLGCLLYKVGSMIDEDFTDLYFPSTPASYFFIVRFRRKRTNKR